MRKCDGCTACCEGTLHTKVLGQEIYPGRPCHYLGPTGCTIYKDPKRPKDPCDTYTCAWLENTDNLFPEWLRPDRSKVIPTFKKYGVEGKIYLRLTEHKSKMDSSVLNWYFSFAMIHQVPISVQIEGGWNHYGPPDFVEFMQNVK